MKKLLIVSIALFAADNASAEYICTRTRTIAVWLGKAAGARSGHHTKMVTDRVVVQDKDIGNYGGYNCEKVKAVGPVIHEPVRVPVHSHRPVRHRGPIAPPRGPVRPIAPRHVGPNGKCPGGWVPQSPGSKVCIPRPVHHLRKGPPTIVTTSQSALKPPTIVRK